MGTFDSVAGYRLFTPLGYWNALGLFAAIGVLLALGIAARGASPVARGLAGASLPLLACTLYFTFSRGAWLALAAGLIALVAVSPRRPALIVAVVATGLPAVAAVWVASRSFGLTHREALIAQATHDGHRLAWLLVPLAGIGALAAVGLRRLEPRLALSRRVGRAAAVVVLGALACAAIAAVVAKGGPVALAKDGYHSFASPTPADAGGADLNQRLFQFSGTGRARLSEVAVDAYRDHPLLGTGAGGYERYFVQHGDGQIVRDAHNLYLETLAELGPLGLLLLLAVLAAPVVAGLRARSVPLVPAALAAYLAFLVHASVDWDWEMTSITVTAILLSAVLLAASRRRRAGGPARDRPPGGGDRARPRGRRPLHRGAGGQPGPRGRRRRLRRGPVERRRVARAHGRAVGALVVECPDAAGAGARRRGAAGRGARHAEAGHRARPRRVDALVRARPMERRRGGDPGPRPRLGPQPDERRGRSVPRCAAWRVTPFAGRAARAARRTSSSICGWSGPGRAGACQGGAACPWGDSACPSGAPSYRGRAPW